MFKFPSTLSFIGYHKFFPPSIFFRNSRFVPEYVLKVVLSFYIGYDVRGPSPASKQNQRFLNRGDKAFMQFSLMNMAKLATAEKRVANEQYFYNILKNWMILSLNIILNKILRNNIQMLIYMMTIMLMTFLLVQGQAEDPLLGTKFRLYDMFFWCFLVRLKQTANEKVRKNKASCGIFCNVDSILKREKQTI